MSDSPTTFASLYEVQSTPNVSSPPPENCADGSPYRVTLAVDGSPLWDGYVSDRDRHLRQSFGLKLTHYEAIFAAQDGKCGICGKAPRKGSVLYVDHDHDPPHEVRGLLCSRCNGRLTQAMTRYLADPPARKVGPWFVPEEIEAYYQQANAKKAAARARRTQAKRVGREQAEAGPPTDETFAARVQAALEQTTEPGGA